MHHYVYRITNIPENKHYYGVRTSIDYPINDLGIKYFSSSVDKDFIKEQKHHPNKFKYKIIKTFLNRDEAYSYEIKLHNKFNVGVNDNFYNKAKATSCGFTNYGVPNSKTSNLKRSKSLKGKKRNISVEHGNNLSKALKGKPKSKQHATNISKGNKGKSKSDSHKLNLRKPKKKSICPHCGTLSTKTWHFDNCKKNPNYKPRKKSNYKISNENRNKMNTGIKNNRRSYNTHLNPKAKPILIDNICFLSIKDAMIFLNLSRYKISQISIYLDK